MDYETFDSSGTDDDLPVQPQQQNRVSRGGGRFAGNGRQPAPMGSIQHHRMYEETDTETSIHELEQEAYVSVLRAFRAQADSLTWEKESLLTELRKELRLSNEEYRFLLSKVNTDETIKRIREQTQSGGLLQQDQHDASQIIHDPLPSPPASRKKQKITPNIPPQPYAGPSPSFRSQMMPSANQPSLPSSKRGPGMGPKGKKHAPLAADSSTVKMYPAGPAGRGQFGNQMPSEEGASLINRKVRTRWPDDNNFYEAVITDYNADEGRHLLYYDKGTANESWEWVNLSEIPQDDLQWVGEDPGVSRRGSFVGPGHGMNRPLDPGPGRGRGIAKVQSKKEFPPSENGIGKKGRDDIQLLHTDTLIKEVERVFSSGNRDPMEVEKAKKVLKEHEQALIDAITRLNDLSDGESDDGGRYLHRQAM